MSLRDSLRSNASFAVVLAAILVAGIALVAATVALLVRMAAVH